MFSDKLGETFKVGKKKSLIYGIFMAFFSFFSFGTVLAVLWYGGKLVSDGDISIGKNC